MVKRILKVVGVIALVLLVGVGALFYSMFGSNPEIPEGRELEGVCRLVKDGFVSVAMLDAGPGAVALIDAGNDPSGQALLAELKRRNLGPEAVKAIFLTHGHSDHVAGCHLFPKAEVMALAGDIPLAEGTAGSKGPITQFLPPKDSQVHVTRALKDGETVQVGTLAIRVLALPGHTPGSAAYFTRGLLFLGDSADATREGTLVGAKWHFTDDGPGNRASLQALPARLAPDPVKYLVFAHTGVLEGDGALRAFAAK